MDPISTSADSRAIALARRVLRIEAAAVAALADRVGEEFERAVDIILKRHGRVIVTGIGKSGHIARKIAATLASTGTPAYFVHAAEAAHGDLGMITPEDVVLALSNSGSSEELLMIVPLVKRQGARLIAMTGKSDAPLARQADAHLEAAVAEEACPLNLAPTASTTAALALGDALAVALLEARGFSRQDFYVYHPGGKLGAQLKTVATIMHSGERLPIVGATAAMADVVEMISAKSFGCAIVIDAEGRLAGIVTDGDLRRKLGAGWGGRLARDVMTADPRRIAPDALAVEALEMVNRMRVTALIVADAQERPVGLVHVHDLLNLGVV